MNMNIRVFFLAFLVFVLPVFVFAQSNAIFKVKTGDEEPYYKNEWYFGISLVANSSGQMVRFGFIKIHEDGRKEITWLTRDNFILQATGQQPSKANKNKENFFEKYQIKWDIFDELWKLRYAEWPYDDQNRLVPGWAGKMFVPSDAQWAYLKKNYDYGALADFLYGENMWKLLQDAQDPNWIAQYSSLK